MKITFIFSCSGMFRNVPCTWFYRRPSFEASGANFVGREATERATKPRGRMTLKFGV